VLTTLLDLLGIALLVSFAYILFAPSALAVGGLPAWCCRTG
jgi:uncharacterized membrane protein